MTSTSACPGLPEMVRLVSGEADLAELEQLYEHVRGCRSCQDTMCRLRLGDALTQALRSELPGGDRGRALLRGLQQLLRPTETPPTQHWGGSDIFEATSTPPADNWAAILQPPQGPDELGRLGPYRVLRVLGRGGMGTVF